MIQVTFEDKIRRMCTSCSCPQLYNKLLYEDYLTMDTKQKIENGNLSLKVIYTVFCDADYSIKDGFDERVNALLQDQNYIIKLELRLK